MINNLNFQIELTKILKLVRNEFKTVGKYGIPLIKKQEIDLDKVNGLIIFKFNRMKINLTAIAFVFDTKCFLLKIVVKNMKIRTISTEPYMPKKNR